MRSITRVFLVLAVSFAIFSCGTRKEIVYMNDIEKAKSYEENKKFEAVLQPDDLLSITVNADNPEVAMPFNLPSVEGNDSDHQGLKTYLIDNAGYIDYPVLGKLKLAGLTQAEARNKMVTALTEYITNPAVAIRILNYKISVLGEVTRPNTYPIQGERVTLLEGLSLAGDMTIYGKRDNILVIREVEGKKTYARIDITKSDFFNSPYYYLAQNDVVYVEPNKTKIHSSTIGPDIYILFSGVSVLTTLIVLLAR